MVFDSKHYAQWSKGLKKLGRWFEDDRTMVVSVAHVWKTGWWRDRKVSISPDRVAVVTRKLCRLLNHDLVTRRDDVEVPRRIHCAAVPGASGSGPDLHHDKPIPENPYWRIDGMVSGENSGCVHIIPIENEHVNEYWFTPLHSACQMVRVI